MGRPLTRSSSLEQSRCHCWKTKSTLGKLAEGVISILGEAMCPVTVLHHSTHPAQGPSAQPKCCLGGCPGLHLYHPTQTPTLVFSSQDTNLFFCFGWRINGFTTSTLLVYGDAENKVKIHSFLYRENCRAERKSLFPMKSFPCDLLSSRSDGQNGNVCQLVMLLYVERVCMGDPTFQGPGVLLSSVPCMFVSRH